MYELSVLTARIETDDRLIPQKLNSITFSFFITLNVYFFE